MYIDDIISQATCLYEIIFNEKVANSKEFTTFVNLNNPNPLRIKVEDYILNVENNPVYSSNLELATELDKLIMIFIERMYE